MKAFHFIQAFRVKLQRLIAIDNDRIKAANIISYSPERSLSDMADDDHITYKMLQDYVEGAGAIAPLEIPLPAGSPYPLNVIGADLGAFINGFKNFSQVQEVDDTSDTLPARDVVINRYWTDNTKTTLASIDIFGHADSDDPTITQDNLIIIIY